MAILQSENRFPDCLYMELQEMFQDSGSIELPITLRFDEQEIALKNGSIKFGLKGGELSLELTNGILPKNCRNLTGLIELQLHNIAVEVTTNNSDQQPKWWFELKFGSQVLKGSIRQQSLGKLEVQNKPCNIYGTFSIRAKDLCLTRVNGAYPQNLSRNKKLLLNRAIAKKIFESKCQPYLSQVVLQYGE